MYGDSLGKTMALLHHALRLPALLWRGEACCLTMPDAGDAPLPPADLPARFDQLIAGSAQELPGADGLHYLALRADENAVIVLGPYVQEDDRGQEQAALPRLSARQRQAAARAMAHLLAASQAEAPGGKPARAMAHLLTASQAEAPGGKPARDLALRESMSALFSHPPFFLEQELAGAIMLGDGDRAVRALGEINRLERARVAGDPLRSLKNSLIGSCALCSRAAISGGVPADAAFTLADEFIRAIEDRRDAKALAALEEDMVSRFSSQVAQLRDSGVSSIVRGAMRYIDEHLSDKLRLDSIARQVYVHPDYLSARFKRETGEGISRYIQRRRVQEACRFLRYSAYPIARIAGYYQFSSQSAFSKVFKQYQGLTPRQYRERGAPGGAIP